MRTHAIARYFASDGRRTLQTALGLLWLLDGALQFQSFMYSRAFPQMLTAMEPGQPHWLASSIAWGARFGGGDLPLWNTLFALTQVALGLGLLFRPTVKPALAASYAWTAVVWWFGEALGMLLARGAGGPGANPLTGAPGAVVLYALVGLVAWPNDRAGGLLGARGARLVFAGVWAGMAWLWLLGPNSSPDATRDAIASAPSGMEWLSVVQRHATSLAAGRGTPIAVILAAVSLTIAIGVAVDPRPQAYLRLAIGVSAVYWVVGQGLGGLATGTATDPNAAPLFVLFSAALLGLRPERVPAPRTGRAARPALPARAAPR